MYFVGDEPAGAAISVFARTVDEVSGDLIIDDHTNAI